MDRGAWWPTVHRTVKSQTWLSTDTGVTSFHVLQGSKNCANQEATQCVDSSSSRCDVETCQALPWEVSALPSPGVQSAGLTMGRDRIVTFILRTVGNH